MTRITTLFLILVMLVSVTGVCLAQPPAPPRGLTGAYSPVVVTLTWHQPESPTAPTSYKIYRFGSDWEWHLPPAIGVTSDTTFQDTSVAPGHLYSYAVTAVYNGTLESFPSNPVRVFTGVDTARDSSHVKVWFTSQPVISATVGQPYQYQPTDSTDPAGVAVCFRLGEGPHSMTVDQTTGLLQWTPAHPGMYEVKLIARPCGRDGERAEQEFTILVLNGGSSSLSGTVSDSNGHGVSDVKVKLFDVGAGDFVLRTSTDDSGHYSFPLVNPSTYYIRVNPERDGFAPQWYDGAGQMSSATPVVIPDSSTVTVNITLKSRQKVFFTLSGTVTDDSSHPVAGAAVVILRTDHDTTEGRQYDDHHDGWDRLDSDHGTQTDHQGHYSFRLRPGDYVVGVLAHGFLPQYWNQHSSPLDADHIVLGSDTTGIDFVLSPRPQAKGIISGTIRSSVDSSGLAVHVIGFRKDSTGHFTHWRTFTRSDSTGAYALEHLPDGAYVVLAFGEHDIIPTFYNSGSGTPHLDSAVAVVVSGGGAVTGIDIYATPDSVDGLNGFSGHVNCDTGSHSGKIAAHPESLSPLGGVIVTAINQLHEPVGSSVTASDGSFLIAGLAPGAYSVVFQSPGVASLTVTAGLQYLNNQPSTQTVNVQMSASGSSAGATVLNILAKWNLVSVPVTVTDNRASVLFPGAVSRAFSYQAAYQPQDALTTRSAYWIKFGTDQQVGLAGTPVTTATVDVVPGWNLVGSISAPVSVSSITSNPPGMSTSTFFGYDGRYSAADVIVPGKGYWVKVTGAGALTLSTAQAGSAGLIKISPSSELPPSPPGEVSSTGSGVPQQYGLADAYPNPFNPEATITYQLPVQSRVTLKVYNTLGELVATLVDGIQDAGSRSIRWDAAVAGGMSSGVYFYRLDATSTQGDGRSFTETRRMILVK
jgi:protocatechuate 3,4-dioxygenase beta subunit